MLAISSGDDLTGYEGKRPRELDWSSLAGTCSLLYYQVCVYMYVSDLANESQHRLSMWQHALGACIKHSQGMEEKKDMMQSHGSGRMERKERRT